MESNPVKCPACGFPDPPRPGWTNEQNWRSTANEDVVDLEME